MLEVYGVYTPDDVLSGSDLKGPVVIYDFDHYYMGSCLAERLRGLGHEVTIVTPASTVSAWTFMNNELAEIRARMMELGIATITEHQVTEFKGGAVQLAPVHGGGPHRRSECGSLVVVGTRIGNDELFLDLKSDPDALAEAGIASLRAIGDCRAPGAIAHAVYSGHECARAIGTDEADQPFKWERPAL